MKQFNPELYEQYDWKARASTKEYLRRKNIDVLDNEDIYGPDLIVKDKYYVECEIKVCWSGKFFHWGTLQFSTRKTKFCHLDLPTVFFVWNEPGTSGICFTQKTLLSSEQESVPNCENPDGSEKFYIVDIKKVKHITL